MAIKALGLWRGELEKGKPKPKRCNDSACRSTDLDYDRMVDDDEVDDELAEAWGADFDDERFSFMPAYAVCEECGNAMAYGPNYYFNSESGTYDLPRPLTPAEALIAERQAEIDSGQLTLFGD